MLSRTADQLFWMARYMERAENTARLLDVNVTTSLLPQSREATERGWRAMLGICELQPSYEAAHGRLEPAKVLDFMVRSPENPSSIFCCLQATRENARAVRGSLTTDLWETHNDTWLQLLAHLRNGLPARDPKQFFEWVKFRSHLSRGVTIGTMIKDEAFYFARLGTFLERADNTARILDVKFQDLGDGSAPADAGAARYLDFYHWAAVLRSVSAFEIYRRVYRDVITPARVAELLILRPDMPRSLLASLADVCVNLDQVRNSRSSETSRRAGLLHAELAFGSIDDILGQGLHAFLTRFLDRVNDLGLGISRDFLVPLDGPAR